MADMVIVGAGVVGLGLGMLLAQDAHRVTILERDPDPLPGSAEEAFERWERTGVTQFRLPHLFLARFREIVETELPEVAAAIEADGGLRFNLVSSAPDELTGGPRPGDHRFEMLSGRRPVVERAIASVAERTQGLTIRRGVAVRGLVAGHRALPGVPHVTGVRTTAGERLSADLIVDCSGRRSAAATWLEALGAARPDDQVEDSGFLYLGRHFRSHGGALPASVVAGLQEWGSISTLALPADNGTWSVTIVGRAADRVLLGLRDLTRWETLLRRLPTVAHWLDGEPVDERVITISKIEDRRRELAPGGRPVATGLVAVGDAWACTNPSLGRGASIGMIHALALRDTLRRVGLDQPAVFAEAFAEATAAQVGPWYDATVAFDRHRLAEMEALAEGRPYEPDDPAYELTKAMRMAAGLDPDVLRAFVSIVGVLELPEVAIDRPGVMEKVIGLGASWRDEPASGPDRAEIVAIATS